MAIVPVLPDYSDKDFASVKFRLRNLIHSVFPEWSDDNVANFGNILVELYAHVIDILAYYQDAQARNTRISTATDRKAILGLVKLIGFAPSTATAATVDVRFGLASVPAYPVTIPAGTRVLTADAVDPISYQTITDAVIPAGQTPPTVVVSAENSETVEEAVVSTGAADQEVLLARAPYIDGRTVITAGNGVYTQVSNFLSSVSSDRHYTVTVDQSDKALVRFGDGVNGQVPVGAVTIAYRVGGGSGGRVEALALKRVEGAILNSVGESVVLSVTNPSKSSGGTDRQSIAQIQERAPASLTVAGRSVSRSDFEINALRIPDVARALMLTSNESPGVPENTGLLYIVPVGGGAASGALLDAVRVIVTETYPATLTFSVDVRSARYRVVDIFSVVHLRKGASPTVVGTAIRAALSALFAIQNPDSTSNPGIDFGSKLEGSALALSDIENAVRDVAGVRKLSPTPGDFTIGGEHDDLVLEANEFPVLGAVTILDGDTGLAL